jgi:hypothetical protein
MNQLPPEFYSRAEAIRDEVRAVSQWLQGPPIENDDRAAGAADALAKLRKTLSETEAAHKADKAPHLEACRDFDAAYKPLIAQITEAANRVKARISDWIAIKERRRQEEAAAARAAAAKAAQEAAAAARAAEAAAHDIAAKLEAEQAAADAAAAEKAAAKIEAAKVSVSGRYTQRAVVAKKIRQAVLTDWRAALKWAHADDGRKLALKAWLEQQATAAVRHGAAALPGFTIEYKEVVS